MGVSHVSPVGVFHGSSVAMPYVFSAVGSFLVFSMGVGVSCRLRCTEGSSWA